MVACDSNQFRFAKKTALFCLGDFLPLSSICSCCGATAPWKINVTNSQRQGKEQSRWVPLAESRAQQLPFVCGICLEHTRLAVLYKKDSVGFIFLAVDVATVASICQPVPFVILCQSLKKKVFQISSELCGKLTKYL